MLPTQSFKTHTLISVSGQGSQLDGWNSKLPTSFRESAKSVDFVWCLLQSLLSFFKVCIQSEKSGIDNVDLSIWGWSSVAFLDFTTEIPLSQTKLLRFRSSHLWIRIWLLSLASKRRLTSRETREAGTRELQKKRWFSFSSSHLFFAFFEAF